MRTANLMRILNENENFQNLNELKKSMYCLFNEYKLVIEAVLFEYSLPYNYDMSIKQNDLTFNKSTGIYANFDCKLNRKNKSSHFKIEKRFIFLLNLSNRVESKR